MESSSPQLRVLFLGMHNDTSALMLEALLAAGIVVCGVLLAAEHDQGPPIARAVPPPPSPLPIANPFLRRTIAQIAWQRDIPVFEARRLDAPAALAQLGELQPDLGCVACFPLRLPAPLLALPPQGFLNMHPALLPAHRGPAPLFWIFRSGAPRAGVTIHFMDQGLDSGDIVLQAAFDLPDGCSGRRAELRAAELGSQLMLEALRRLAAGTLARRPQPPGGSYEPWPTLDNWRLDVSWTARHAFNFMRGTAEWGQPYQLALDGTDLWLASALGYDADATLAQAYQRTEEGLLLRFAQGVLLARER